MGIPVSTGTFTFSDFQEKLNSGDVSIAADGSGLLTLVYEKDSLFSQRAEDMVNIDNEVFSTSVSIGLPVLNNLPVTGTINHTEPLNFNIGKHVSSAMKKEKRAAGN